MKVFVEDFSLQMPKSVGRSTGLHLSEVIRDLAYQHRILEKKADGVVEEDRTEMMQVGLAWEDYLAAHQHPNIEFHPGELMLDGIAMSPDGISIVDGDDYGDLIGVEPGSWILHEFKCTRKSSRDFRANLRQRAKKCLMWLWQVEGYRYAINKTIADKECYISKLHVMFLNGNYSWDEKDPESMPSYRIFRLEHDPQELEDTWGMIRDHAQTMLERGRDVNGE